MAVGDYISAIATRIVALHTANTAWAAIVKPSNRVTRLGVPWPPKVTMGSKAPADMCEWDLRLLRSAPIIGGPLSPPVTFCAAVGVPARISRTVTHLLTITAPDLRQSPLTILEAYTESILFAAGNKLKLAGSPLAWVSGVEGLTTDYAETKEGTGGTLRLQAKIQIPVNVSLSADDVLG